MGAGQIMLDSITVYLQHADPAAIYVFLFCIAFLENVVPPIPGDVPVAFIGYLIHHSRISFFCFGLVGLGGFDGGIHAGISSEPPSRDEALCRRWFAHAA